VAMTSKQLESLLRYLKSITNNNFEPLSYSKKE
jgi:hypothetical protein